MLAELEPFEESPNRRSKVRRKLRLLAEGRRSSSAAAVVVIHDLSQSGLLIEAAGDLQTGEALEVEIPEGGTVRAKVMWNSGQYSGCQFVEPISVAALSAALLKSQPAQPNQNPAAAPAPGSVAEIRLLRAHPDSLNEDYEQPIERLHINRNRGAAQSPRLGEGAAPATLRSRSRSARFLFYTVLVSTIAVVVVQGLTIVVRTLPQAAHLF